MRVAIPPPAKYVSSEWVFMEWCTYNFKFKVIAALK
jgi:hypothetical protein